ncbi:nucleoside ABC transporter [Cutibacterium acnes JCM 18916]|nr:nucleoside ABC transporter [Cutibacterium acnes JCM 18916]
MDAKCSIIVSVGFLLEKPTLAAAKANPNVKFAIVDDNPANPPENLKPLIFNTAQSSFEAGYLASALTKTGKVATFGGMKIPTVTIFMDGFFPRALTTTTSRSTSRFRLSVGMSRSRTVSSSRSPTRSRTSLVVRLLLKHCSTRVPISFCRWRAMLETVRCKL